MRLGKVNALAPSPTRSGRTRGCDASAGGRAIGMAWHVSPAEPPFNVVAVPIPVRSCRFQPERKRTSANRVTQPSQIAAIVLAAGAGTRMGDADATPKQFRDVGGEPMLRRSVRAFLEWGCSEVIVALPRGRTEEGIAALGKFAQHVRVVHGAGSRAASTRRALEAVEASYVMVHDAARPFVSSELLGRIAESLAQSDGVIPTLPVTDTVKRVDGDRICETLPRGELRLAQTPQLFRTEVLVAAHDAAERSAREFTDDASLVEAAGGTVRIVDGDRANRKITTADDLPPSDAARSGPDVRVGHGYDTHRTAPGATVWLCGIEVPAPFSLDGHSDADVGLHALVDALLGTCGEGDIGSHFPPSDETWRGAASHRFLTHARELVAERGGRVTCADVTLVCEAPKIGPHRDAMRDRIASLLGIARDRVSVKATTNERIGFIGRNEGFAALATATVIYD